MEEENLVKKENEVVNTNNNSNNKNVIIAFLVVIIIALMGAIIYFNFIKKDDKPTSSKVENNDIVDKSNDSKEKDNQTVDKPIDKKEENNQIVDNNKNGSDESEKSLVSSDSIELYVDKDTDESIKSIKLKNQVFEVKLAGYSEENGTGDLYLNGTKISTIDYNSVIVSVVDKYLIVAWPGAQGGSLALGYINESGVYYPIYSTGVEVLNVRFENGKLYCDTIDTSASYYDTKKVELIINGSSIKIEDIK